MTEWGSPAWCAEHIVQLERRIVMTEQQRNQLQRERDELAALNEALIGAMRAAMMRLADTDWTQRGGCNDAYCILGAALAVVDEGK